MVWKIEVVRVGKRVFDIWCRKGKTITDFGFACTERQMIDGKLQQVKPSATDDNFQWAGELREAFEVIINAVFVKSEAAA